TNSSSVILSAYLPYKDLLNLACIKAINNSPSSEYSGEYIHTFLPISACAISKSMVIVDLPIDGAENIKVWYLGLKEAISSNTLNPVSQPLENAFFLPFINFSLNSPALLNILI